MKPIAFVVLSFIGLMLIHEVAAQKNRSKPGGTAKAAGNTPAQLEVVLGASGLSGGTVSKRTFDSLVMQGLHPAGNNGTVSSFQFIYAERNLYEDSVGNPLITTDYLSEFCHGDTLSVAIKDGLTYRTKPGDTAYFDQIRIVTPNGQPAKGKAMRFVLQP